MKDEYPRLWCYLTRRERVLELLALRHQKLRDKWLGGDKQQDLKEHKE